MSTQLRATRGPDADAFEKATSATLAFMFESRYRLLPTEFALDSGLLDTRYADCWAGLGKTP